MKKLIMINGTMGVGKSTVCRELFKTLTPSAYLDGDWCWNMNPFIVNNENKKMVIDNITYLLKSYLNNSGYEYVIFCWVIPSESIFQDILNGLKSPYKLYKLTLTCSENVLQERILKDVRDGKRENEVLDRSLAYLDFYSHMNTHKIDVSNISVEETVKEICKIIKR